MSVFFIDNTIGGLSCKFRSDIDRIETAMTTAKDPSPTADAVRSVRQKTSLTQTQAAHLVHASLRSWQQWEAGDRAMPPGLFELFMIKTGQWPLERQG